MGLHSFSRRQLVSRHHPVAHARLPIVRRKPGSASFQQRRHSRTRRHRVISYFGLADCKNLAKRICRHCLRHSSATSGIGAMDRRAQRCPERFILRAYSAGLVQPRMQEIVGALFDCAPCRRAWNAFQIDAVHDSVRAFANRLLAAESFSKEKIISLILEKIPFALFAAASAVATVLGQHGRSTPLDSRCRCVSKTQSLATRSICVS